MTPENTAMPSPVNLGQLRAGMFHPNSLAALLIVLGLLFGAPSARANDSLPLPATVEIQVTNTAVVCQTIMRFQKVVGFICYVSRGCILVAYKLLKGYTVEYVLEQLKKRLADELGK